MNERFSSTLSLKFRQNGNRAQAVPILTAIGDGYRGKRYMADHLPINLGYQRDRKRIGSPQGIYYEWLGVIANGMILESRFGDLEYYFNI